MARISTATVNASSATYLLLFLLLSHLVLKTSPSKENALKT